MIFKAYWAEFYLICIKVFAHEEIHSSFIDVDVAVGLCSTTGVQNYSSSNQENST